MECVVPGAFLEPIDDERSMLERWMASKTDSSWMNFVVHLLTYLTTRWLRRGPHRWTKELELTIDNWIAHWNKEPSHSSGTRLLIRSSTGSGNISKKRGRCASEINAPWPWSVHSASSPMPSPASPTRAFGCVAGLQLFADELRPLRRLRLHGLVERAPGTNAYAFTSEGIRVADFCTKVRAHLFGPLLDADQPLAPVELTTPSAPWSTCSATT